MFYAQLNDELVCFAISQVNSVLESTDKIIELAVFDTDKLWRKYEKGTWSKQKYEPPSLDVKPEEMPLDCNENQLPSVTLEDTIYASMYVTAMLDVFMSQSSLIEAAQPVSVSSTGLRLVSDELTPTDAREETETPRSPRYEFWRNAYFSNHTPGKGTPFFVLERLVGGGVLTQEEVDGMVAERINIYGV